MLNFKNPTIWIGSSALILSIILTLLILFLFKFLPPKLPLFYSLPWGEKQLAIHQQFLIIPASITIATLVNLIISLQLHSSQTFFKKVLLITSFVFCLILIVTLIKIVLIFI